MPVITSIKQQKNKKRVNVYLDGEFGFGIDLDNFVLLHLKVGQEISEKEVEDIVKKADFQKTLDKLLRFATVRPRSQKEFTDYFRRKKVHLSLHEKLLDKLKHFELIDDEKFAGWWVEQRQNFRPKPKRVLQQELGYAGDVEFVCAMLDDAYSNCVRYLFVIKNCKKVAEPKPEDDEEDVELIEMTISDFRKHLQKGQLSDIEAGYRALDYLNLL